MYNNAIIGCDVMHINSDKIDYFKKSQLISLSSDQINKLNSRYNYEFYNKYFFNINGNIFHVKHCELEVITNELLGQIISGYLGIKTVKSKVFKSSKGYYLVTENFIEEGKKYTNISDDIFPDLEFDTLDSRLEIYNLNNFGRIRKTSGEDIFETDHTDLLKFKRDLKGMIICDYIRDQKDRCTWNVMIEYNKNHVLLAPLYDFEHSFIYGHHMCANPNLFIVDFNDKSTIKMIRKDNDFQELLYKTIDLNFDDIANTLYNEYGITLDRDYDDYLDIIKYNQYKIKKLKLLR